MSIAAGWYPDPLDANAVRWWQGEAWSDFVQPIPQPVPQPWVQPAPAPHFSPTPVVPQPYEADPWAPLPAVSGPYGYPRPPRRRSPWLAGVAVALVVVALVAGAVQLSVSRGADAKVAATTYVQALERGDTAAAYRSWCAADRAVYPEAMFRAQHEWRAGHPTQVLSSFAHAKNKASVGIRDDKGIEKDLPLEQTDEGWAICPRGDRLKGDMANCGCMTPTQLLESYVAYITAPQPDKNPFVEVSCPTIPALVDGKAVRCSAEAADGRTWTVIATERAHATRTDLQIEPSGTVS